MTGDRSQLTNFVNKFLGTVKFGNDHVEKIMGYGDYKIGNVTISRVYFIKGLGHNLFSVGQFCDSDLEVAFRQHTCFIRNLEGVDLLTGSRGNNLYTMSLGDMMASSHICHLSKASKTKSWLWHRRVSHLNFGAINYLARQGLVRVAHSPQQNNVVEIRNRTLIEAARTMLIYAQALLFLWIEAVATACYTQNHSIVRLRHSKTPYELLHGKLLDLSFLHVFGALCYPTNDSENLRKLQPKADIGIFIGYAPTKKAFWIYNRRTRRIIETIHVDFDELTAMASEQSSSGPAIHEMTPATISSGLVPKPTFSTPLETAEIVIPEVEEIEDENLREKLLNVNLLIATIETLKDNPTQSSELLTKSSSTSLNSLLEETNTFHNSLPEFENFYFDLGEISSGSTTTHSDISLPDYEAFSFDDDHIKEISSGSTTTHSDISLSEYDSFIFNFAYEEFVDELTHIISSSKYDCFYFRDLPDPGELMSVLNFGIRENLLSATSVNLPIEDDHSPLLTYVVWIFVAYLTYLVIPPYLYPFGNEDTI
nr:integrase, catalytic region, zinc finger, CCHC-type, peptidase aspartic, catalytic [Tanacetum cinerariifolium]